ncbi:hypothetical protein BV22DRAFT_1109016 [Leucogyrophana mollusca]|uniref:Uncharacterized protein n=1 Tax=Leucogyrophana mollusca TaxID=85980 RepID=A0ACB8BXW9_9AGAM|nr:hypothetical protein BV22DRAFT_1109016 [Leucogyrophana mollusca]
MSWRATDNLRCYIQDALLPEMRLPPSARNIDLRHALDVQLQRCRRLKAIHRLDLSSFNEYVSSWTEHHIPCVSLGVEDEDSTSGERFSIPCPPYFDVPVLPLFRPKHVNGLLMWMDHYPLESLRRALHLLYPETKSWQFVYDNMGADRTVFRSLTWSENTQDQGHKLSYRSITVYVLPPWVLSAADIEQFAAHQPFPSTARGSDTCPTTGQQRLWGKLWDSCVSKDCPWFVISTYTHWVFGVFSEGWTAAFVSPVYSYDSHDPSVLEVLIFWFASAMGLPGGWQVPEVRIEPAYPRLQLTAVARDILAAGPPKALALSAIRYPGS